jgi:glycosyltransferase involved in cell wall biosynthesis
MGWAISCLTASIVKHQKHRFNFFHLPIHPRGVAGDTMPIADLLKRGVKFDLWHAQYWNSTEQAQDTVMGLKEVPILLSIHNHYQVTKIDYKRYKRLHCPTKWLLQNTLVKGDKSYVPYGVDLERYKYITEPKAENTVGYVGRVMPHKNLAVICRVAKEIGAKVVGSGYIEKPDYWATVDKSVLEFEGGVGRGAMNWASKKDKLYEKMTVFVAYSTEEKETGTLPILEAMARGVPVLATRQGMARDILEHEKNALLFDTEAEFKEQLVRILQDKPLRDKLRKAAYSKVMQYSEQRNAREMAKTYFKTLYPKQPLISVVIPTYKRNPILMENLFAIEENDYPAKEVIVVSDDPEDIETRIMCQELKKRMKTPVIYLNTGLQTYGLAKARNIGALEALGEQIVFLDDRLRLEPTALTEISKWHEKKIWYWGDKVTKTGSSTKPDFVENFSWINRDDYFNLGGCNERIEHYGGMSFDLRHRLKWNGYKTAYMPTAKAKEVCKTSKHYEDLYKGKLVIQQMYE